MLTIAWSKAPYNWSFSSGVDQRAGAYALRMITGPAAVLSLRVMILSVPDDGGSMDGRRVFLTVKPTP